VTTQISLSDYSSTPLYNIKAVVQATGISSSTLRAWERRYQMVTPYRSDSGYRLYSDQDIAVIHWLKMQVDSGMSISQAVAWLEQISSEAGDRSEATLPGSAEAVMTPSTSPDLSRTQVRSFDSLQQELLKQLLAYDEQHAERTISEAFAMYTVEEVGESLFVPVLTEIGERWHQGEVSITQEHFATRFLMQRLMALMRVSNVAANSAMIWVGCAPGELHEMGALLLSLYLRRAGHQVHYLGGNLPTDDIVEEVKTHQPKMLLLSAGSQEAATRLKELTDKVKEITPAPTIVGYGGRIFNQEPELRNDIVGIFLGESAQNAVDVVDDLLQTNQ
jgi:methanogenic corrinoid protein MtbC1